MLSMHELSLPEPMLSLSMLILATCPEHAQECSEQCSARSERSARPERSEHFWTPGNTVRVQHSIQGKNIFLAFVAFALGPGGAEDYCQPIRIGLSGPRHDNVLLLLHRLQSRLVTLNA